MATITLNLDGDLSEKLAAAAKLAAKLEASKFEFKGQGVERVAQLRAHLEAISARKVEINLDPKALEALRGAEGAAARLDRRLKSLSEAEFNIRGNGAQVLEKTAHLLKNVSKNPVKVSVDRKAFDDLHTALEAKAFRVDTREARKQIRSLGKHLRDAAPLISFRVDDRNIARIEELRAKLSKHIQVKVTFIRDGDIAAGALGAAAEQAEAKLQRALKLLEDLKENGEARPRRGNTPEKKEPKPERVGNIESFEVESVKAFRSLLKEYYGEAEQASKINQELARRFDVLKDTAFELGATFQDFNLLARNAAAAGKQVGVEFGLMIRLSERLIDETENVNTSQEDLARAARLVKNRLDDASGVAVTYAAVLRGEASALRALGPQYEEQVKALEQIENRELRRVESLKLLDKWNREQEESLRTAPGLLNKLNAQYAVVSGTVLQTIANVGPFGRAVAVSAGIALGGLVLLAAGAKRAIESMVESYTGLDREAKGRVEAVKRQFELLEAEILLATLGGEQGFERLTDALVSFLREMRELLRENKRAAETFGDLFKSATLLAGVFVQSFTIPLIPLGYLIDLVKVLSSLLPDLLGAAWDLGQGLAEAFDKGTSAAEAFDKAVKGRFEGLGLGDAVLDVNVALSKLTGQLAGFGSNSEPLFNLVYDDEALSLFIEQVENLVDLEKERLAVRRALRSEDERSLLSAIKQKEERQEELRATERILAKQVVKAFKFDDDALSGGFSSQDDPYLKDTGKGTKQIEQKLRAVRAELQQASVGLGSLRSRYEEVLRINAQAREELLLMREALDLGAVDVDLVKAFDLDELNDKLEEASNKFKDMQYEVEETLRVERARLDALAKGGADIDEANLALKEQEATLRSQLYVSEEIVKATQKRRDIVAQLTDYERLQATIDLQRKVSGVLDSSSARSQIRGRESAEKFDSVSLILLRSQAEEQQKLLGGVDEALTKEIEKKQKSLALVQDELWMLREKERLLVRFEEVAARENGLLDARLRVRHEADRFSLTDLRAQRREVDDRLSSGIQRLGLLDTERQSRVALGLDTGAVDEAIVAQRLQIAIDTDTKSYLEEWPLTFSETLGVALYEGFLFGGQILSDNIGALADAVSEIGEQGQEARRALEEGFENSLSDIGAAGGASLGAALHPAAAPFGGLLGGIAGALIERFWDTESEKRAREEEARRRAEEEARAAKERHRQLTELFKEMLRVQGRTADNTTRFLEDRADVQDVRVLVNTLRNEGRLY
jgi:hypothetical protein